MMLIGSVRRLPLQIIQTVVAAKTVWSSDSSSPLP